MLDDKNGKASCWFIAAAVFGGVFQFWWFASKCFNQIDIDGMAYVGIARHLRQGEFRASIDAFRSPLFSWLIALGSFASSEYLHVGKFINMGAFVLTLMLLYRLTDKLWQSKLAASLAVLMFTFGRGFAVAAEQLTTPDFLFAALALLYFMVLLRCLRRNRLQDWFWLGFLHGLAYLAKAFALPWLAVCTLAALFLSTNPRKAKVARLALAALLPIVLAAGWATVLHSKYGVFTTGTQFKANLLQWTLHAYDVHRDGSYSLLRDTSENLDEYGVLDPMPPGSWPWRYPISMQKVLPAMIRAEAHNVPRVLKETIIVTTLGGLIAFAAVLAILTRRRNQHPREWRFAMVVVIGALSLVFAYSMLVFDERYLYPLIPLILAVAAGFLASGQFDHHRLRAASIVLVGLGTVAALVYPSSPFRVLTRDFQASCYDAGRRLRELSGSTAVSIGSGPFPEHGVGWEAGYKASFLGGRRMIAAMDSLPQLPHIDSLIQDLRKASPDIILVWGRPGDPRYFGLKHSLMLEYPQSSSEKVLDPVLGEVGMVVFTLSQRTATGENVPVGVFTGDTLGSCTRMQLRVRSAPGRLHPDSVSSPADTGYNCPRD